PAYRAALGRTVERYEGVIPGRLAEVNAALPGLLDGIEDPLREFWLATSEGLRRYLDLKARLVEVEARAEFIGGQRPAARAEAEALRKELAALASAGKAEADERLRSLRDRLGRGDLGAVVSILATVEAHPGDFPPGSSDQVRTALAGVLAGVD